MYRSTLVIVAMIGGWGPLALAQESVKPAPPKAPTSVATPASGTAREPSSRVRTSRPGLIVALEQKRGRPLSPAEEQQVHDALRDAVEEWRTTQSSFTDEAAVLLHTSPDVLESTLPRKGWHRIGATRETGWIPRLEKALGRRLTPDERQRLDRLGDEKHARVWSSRERASERIAKALGMRVADVDAAWPWPAEPSRRPSSPAPQTHAAPAVPASSSTPVSSPNPIPVTVRP